MGKVRVTMRLSDEVDARLRQLAAIERKRIGEAAEDLLDEALPCSAALAARISAQGEEHAAARGARS
jgi:negative regulator of replication initiation